MTVSASEKRGQSRGSVLLGEEHRPRVHEVQWGRNLHGEEAEHDPKGDDPTPGGSPPLLDSACGGAVLLQKERGPSPQGR